MHSLYCYLKLHTRTTTKKHVIALNKHQGRMKQTNKGNHLSEIPSQQRTIQSFFFEKKNREQIGIRRNKHKI